MMQKNDKKEQENEYLNEIEKIMNQWIRETLKKQAEEAENE